MIIFKKIFWHVCPKHQLTLKVYFEIKSIFQKLKIQIHDFKHRFVFYFVYKLEL